jgi:hypothetical protein
MKNMKVAAPIAVALMAAFATPSMSAVNCAMVNKNLERGKTVKAIAEDMAVSEKEIKDCQAQAGTDTNPAAAKGDTAPKGVKPPTMDPQNPNK